jgi:hypothetical protein
MTLTKAPSLVVSDALFQGRPHEGRHGEERGDGSYRPDIKRAQELRVRQQLNPSQRQ